MKVVEVTGRPFRLELEGAIERGLTAAALVDRNGNTINIAGAITDEEAMPLAALVMFRLKSENLSARLFGGEILTLDLDERSVAFCVARRQLFVVAVMPKVTPEALEIVEQLYDEVGGQIQEMQFTPLPGRGGGSDSGPSELELIEYGITVPRFKA